MRCGCRRRLLIPRGWHLGGLVPPLGPPREHPGEPLEQQDGHVGVQNQMTESILESDWSYSGKEFVCK